MVVVLAIVSITATDMNYLHGDALASARKVITTRLSAIGAELLEELRSLEKEGSIRLRLVEYSTMPRAPILYAPLCQSNNLIHLWVYS